MSKFIIGFMALVSVSSMGATKTYFYGCQIKFVASNTSTITAWSVDELVTKIEQGSTYSWYYLGKNNELTQDVLDNEVKEATCLKTEFGAWTCKDVRDNRGYNLPCNRDNLKKIVRYTH